MAKLNQITNALKFNFLGTYSTVIIEFFSIVLLVRYLGIEYYGVYVILLTVFLFLEPLFNLQLDRVLVRYLPEYKDRGDFIASILRYSNKIKFLSFIILSPLVVTLWHYYAPYNFSFVLILISRLFFRVFMLNYSSLLLVYFDHKFVRFSNAIASLTRLFVILLFLPTYNSIQFALLISSIPAFLQFIIFRIRANEFLNPANLNLDDSIKSKIYKMSSRSIIGRYMTHLVWSKSEVIYLGAFYDSVVVSIYSIGYDLVQRFVQLVKSPISDLDLIVGMEYSGKKKDKYLMILKFTNTFLSFFFIPLAGIAFISSETVIPLLFGLEYTDSAFVFRMILIAYSITILAFHINSAIASLELWNLMLIIQLISGFINVSLNFLLIPIYGLQGAVLSVISSLFFMTIFWSLYLLKYYSNLIPFIKIWKMFLASLPLFLSLSMLNLMFSENILIGLELNYIIAYILISSLSIFLGLAAYVALSSYLNIFDKTELSLIQKLNNPFTKFFLRVQNKLARN